MSDNEHWILDGDTRDELAGPYQSRERAIDALGNTAMRNPHVAELIIVDPDGEPTGDRLTTAGTPLL